MNNIQAMELASGLTRLITGMEDELLQNIAAYLLAGKIESDSAKWKIRKLAELGKLNKKNIATINSYVKDQRELVELTVKRAVTDAMKDTETGFRKAVMAGLISEAPAGSMEKTMSGIVDTLMKQAKNDLNVVNTVMLYKAKDAAHKAIYDATQIANKQDYLDILNKAAANTATGTESITAAVSHCLKEMADKGIPAFVDHSGREWSPEGYVGMCVRQTCKNTETKALFERMKDYDTHFIEVSSHLGARPKCAKDQGKIFDLNNGSGETEDLNGRKITYYPWSSSSYGEPDGLFGINCHHHAYPFTAGISLQRYFPYDQEENDKRYKEIQQQRELERGVRAAKRQCSMLKDGDPEEFKKASVRLKERTAKLKKYCADHNLTYMNERTSVLGYGHSEAGKVTAAYKKALKYEQLTFYSESGIMEIDETAQSDLGVFKKFLRSDDRVDEEYYQAIKSKFSHGSDTAKTAFTKFVTENAVENSEFEGIAHFNSTTKKISMHYSYDLNNPRGAGATWFHEHGHLIDDALGGISNNTEYLDLLYSDYMSYMQSYGKKNNLNTFDKVQQSIGNDLSEMRSQSAVADLLNGVSKGNIVGIALHDSDYWSDDSVVCSEAFAHMYEAQFDEIRYKEMKKYFPNALKKFESMLSGAIK